jgi:hypothetical protein
MVQEIKMNDALIYIGDLRALMIKFKIKGIQGRTSEY